MTTQINLIAHECAKASDIPIWGIVGIFALFIGIIVYVQIAGEREEREWQDRQRYR